MPIRVSEADLIRHSRRIVEADALVLSLWVALEGWTLAQRLRLVKLSSAAAVNQRPVAD